MPESACASTRPVVETSVDSPNRPEPAAQSVTETVVATSPSA